MKIKRECLLLMLLLALLSGWLLLLLRQFTNDWRKGWRRTNALDSVNVPTNTIRQIRDEFPEAKKKEAGP